MNCWTSAEQDRSRGGRGPGARDGAPAPSRWRRGRWQGGDRGAAVALLCLWLAGSSALVQLAVDVGHLYGVRAALQAAADLGALAGAQELDLDALARGHLRLQEGEAVRAADRWVRENLAAHPVTAPLATAADVEVRVLHPDGVRPARHPWSGRPVRHPTVAVRVVARTTLPWTGRLVGPLRVSARADASVQFRR